MPEPLCLCLVQVVVSLPEFPGDIIHNKPVRRNTTLKRYLDREGFSILSRQIHKKATWVRPSFQSLLTGK